MEGNDASRGQGKLQRGINTMEIQRRVPGSDINERQASGKDPGSSDGEMQLATAVNCFPLSRENLSSNGHWRLSTEL
jgi:hypothetical protein